MILVRASYVFSWHRVNAYNKNAGGEREERALVRVVRDTVFRQKLKDSFNNLTQEQRGEAMRKGIEDSDAQAASERRDLEIYRKNKDREKRVRPVNRLSTWACSGHVSHRSGNKSRLKRAI